MHDSTNDFCDCFSDWLKIIILTVTKEFAIIIWENLVVSFICFNIPIKHIVDVEISTSAMLKND